MYSTNPKKDLCDRIFSRIIRARGACEKCNAFHRLETAHIITRGHLAIRWDVDNAFCLCHRCHAYFTTHPIEWQKYVISKIGEEKYLELRKKSQAYFKVDYEEVLKYLNDHLHLPMLKDPPKFNHRG